MEQQPDIIEQKYWYDGFLHGEKFIPIAGPFGTREEADAIHSQAARAACEVDARTWWETWGVASFRDGSIRGRLNDVLGVKPFNS